MQDRFQLGLITLLVGLGAFAGATLMLRREPVEPTPIPVDDEEGASEILAAGASVTLVLVSDIGGPLSCMATLWQDVEGGRRMGMDSTKRCGPGGVLRWTGLEAGDYRVMAAAEGSERLDLTVELEPGQALDLGSQIVGPGGGLQGTITGPDGEPASIVEILVGEREERSGPSGRFGIKGLRPGPHTLRFGSLEGTAERDIQIVAGEFQELDVLLEPHPGVIGIRFDDLLTVVDVHPTGPASGKIELGVRIESVNGVDFDDREQLEAALGGPAGESVTLGIEGQDVTLVRIPIAEMMSP